jgi:uncharacterized protein
VSDRPATPGGTGGSPAYELAMFPLGSVLLPRMALPLRIFEPRYRRMMSDVLERTPPEFGVVLIERGSEVGGGDTRTGVGCVARVEAHQELPDGQVALLGAGSRRIRVQRWLPEDPYPRALVTDWPDEPGAASLPDLGPITGEVLELAGIAARIGGFSLPHDLEFSRDPSERLFELATITPIGPLDRLRVLSAPSATERLDLLSVLVTEQRILAEARLRFDEG